MVLDREGLDKTVRGNVPNQVEFDKAMPGKARKSSAWHKKNQARRITYGAEQGQDRYD